MVDRVSRTKRSEIMRAVRPKDTRPELAVRCIVSRLGYRFRLHPKALPGKPDLAFPSRRKAIFVHGCFWHGHARCPKARLPKSRVDYWADKLERNKERDRRKARELKSKGWSILVVWQCQLARPERVERRIDDFLRK